MLRSHGGDKPHESSTSDHSERSPYPLANSYSGNQKSPLLHQPKFYFCKGESSIGKGEDDQYPKAKVGKLIWLVLNDVFPQTQSLESLSPASLTAVVHHTRYSAPNTPTRTEIHHLKPCFQAGFPPKIAFAL